jgi:hypothetical protein
LLLVALAVNQGESSIATGDFAASGDDTLQLVRQEDGAVERSCPLDAQAGRIIVEFPEDVVLTTRKQSANSFGPLAANIPSDTYHITLVSFDDHIEHPEEEDQTQESWFLQAENEEGDIVFESNAISDLPEAQNILEEHVEEHVEITQDITGLSARHVLDVGESETAESIWPVCAAFDRVGSDDFDDANVISELPFSDSVDTFGATTASDDPDCVGQGPTVWYAFTPEEDLNVDANTFGSDYDTTLSVYTGSRGNLTQIACNDDTDGLQSRVQFAAVAEETYFFMIGAFGSGPGGQLVFSIDIYNGEGDQEGEYEQEEEDEQEGKKGKNDP